MLIILPNPIILPINPFFGLSPPPGEFVVFTVFPLTVELKNVDACSFYLTEECLAVSFTFCGHPSASIL